jgi:hypothetical protein
MSYYFDGNLAVLSDGSNGGSSLSIGTYSLMAWIKCQTLGVNNNGHIMGRANINHANRNHMLLRVAGTASAIARQSTSADTDVQGAGAVEPTANLFTTGMVSWQCVIATYSSSRTPRWEYFLDGNTSNVNYVHTGAPAYWEDMGFSIGRQWNGNSRSFHGRIAHVAIWNRVISSSEIASLVDHGSPLTVAESGLIRYWPMTQDVSSQVDETGSGHNLSVSGGAVYSSDDPGIAQEEQLDTPTGFVLTASQSARQINGSWNAVAGAATYEYEVQVFNGSSWSDLTSNIIGSTSFQLDSTNGINWSSQYRARVRAHAN